MISPSKLLKSIKKNKINFFTGVPDSVLKNFTNLLPEKKNYIMANEGSSVGLAIGYFLKSKKTPLVYFQNSGLGNAINPLISIAHKKVYSIPLVLLIGWRGAPNLKDEPQHLAQGRVTKKFLKEMGVKFIILSSNRDISKIKKLISFSRKNSKPVAILIKNGSIIEHSKYQVRNNFSLKRIEVIFYILKNISKNCKIFSSTGYISRELNHLTEKSNLNSKNFFYNVGGMGHTSAMSLGYSLFTKKNILCLDGDGSMLMHFGVLANIGNFAKKNFKHILFNNGTHESVGGQKTNVNKINFKNITNGLDYKNYYKIKNNKDLKLYFKKFMRCNGPALCEIFIKNESIKNLGRPTNLIQRKKKFINE